MSRETDESKGVYKILKNIYCKSLLVSLTIGNIQIPRAF